MNAVFSTAAAPFSSDGESSPCRTSSRFARALASHSTGSVTIENATAPQNRTMPALTSIIPRPPPAAAPPAAAAAAPPCPAAPEEISRPAKNTM